MAELHWFPFFAKDWLSSPARMAMTPEQRGAYIDLLAIAWGNGDAQPSLDDDDATLAALSGLGKRWSKLGPLIRAQFMAGDGKLYNHKLTEVWNEQQIKHDKAVERGKTGGRTKAANRKSKSSLATDNGVDGAYQSESEEAVEALKGLLPASAPSGALGVEPPRASAPRLVVDTPPDDGLAAKYDQRLAELVELWTAKHPDDAAELERTSRRDMGLPDGQLSGFAAGALRDRMTSSIRALNPSWPPQEQWIAQQRVKAMESQPQAAEVA